MPNVVRMEIEGVEYSLDTTDLTLGEMEEAKKMGATISTGPEDSVDPVWIRFLIATMKRRAGEVVAPDALKELRMSQIQFLGEANGGPPPNRAARRGNGGSRGTTRA